MGAFLRLTRPLNLLIIAFTMVAMRYGLVGSYLQVSSADLGAMVAQGGGGSFAKVPGQVFSHAFSGLLFWLLVASTVLVAAGGNVINDYFDTRIDRVNKPGQVIVGRSVKRRWAMLGHLMLTSLGVLLGAVVAWRSGQWHLVGIPLFAAAGLWLYSIKFKRTFLLGNGLVALLVGLVPLTVGLYEVPALAKVYGTSDSLLLGNGQEMEVIFGFSGLWAWFLGFSGFAFLTTLVRELQKDMADVKGDAADGCRTVPIVLGTPWAKALTLFYLAVAIAALLLVRSTLLTDRFSYWYIGAGIVLPLLLSAGFTYQAGDRRGFNMAGHLMKAAMGIAVAFAFFIHRVL
jgi:4-hydroxybenzoate polyprenyltransferase